MSAQHTPDGGPAFPVSVPRDFQFANDGMSLRDYFAGQALNGITCGLCANPATDPREPSFAEAQGRFVFQRAARDAYQIADAMLAERAKAGAA